MNLKNERGDAEVVFIICGIVLMGALAFLILFTKWAIAEENVSGIVYNTSNNALFTGNTSFSVRAGENTPIDANNESSYCLPANSPYKELVNKAAADKRIKVNVQTQKGFWVKAPWTCIDNVVVTEVK